MKKDDIVNAARGLFTDYGYKKVSMEEIASKAGVTKKTIYNYFHDKEELFEYFIKEELEKMTEVFEKNLKEKRSFSERITKGLKEILIFRKNSDFIRTIMKDISGNTNFISQYDEAVINYLEEKINIAISKKEIKNLTNRKISYIIVVGGLSEIAGFSYVLDSVFGNLAYVYNNNKIGIRNNSYTSVFGLLKYFDNKLTLRDTECNMFELEDLKKIITVKSRNDSVLNRMLGSFLQNKEDKV